MELPRRPLQGDLFSLYYPIQSSFSYSRRVDRSANTDFPRTWKHSYELAGTGAYECDRPAHNVLAQNTYGISMDRKGRRNSSS